jgi:polyphosphate:AMP phosphotransferase
MFEAAELGHSVDKETYRKRVPALREALLDAQYELGQSRPSSVLFLFTGVKASGKTETIQRLLEWMDPRFIDTHARQDPTQQELEHPPMWRYWRALPPKGRIGIFLGHWYADALWARVNGELGDAAFENRIAEINRFERMLSDEDVVIVKFYLHVTKKQQRKQLDRLAGDPRTAWRVTKEDWESLSLYDQAEAVDEHLVRVTSTPHAPWLVIEGADERYRDLAVGQTVLAVLRRALEKRARQARVPQQRAGLPRLDERTVLSELDLSQKISASTYPRELEKWQGRLSLLSREKKLRKRSVVALFEGNDAAGKGGVIRRTARALDPRIYNIVPIAAPNDEERAHPYLWRFWRRLPQRGHVTIFDRSWYGRVLVERVEGLCSEVDWWRAYSEINDFEAELVDHGIVVVKFWLAISREEQLRRFRERKRTPYKRFKITREDWRNRKKWGAYTEAVCMMVERTSTETARWTLVEAEDKYFARIKVLKTLCARLEECL